MADHWQLLAGNFAVVALFISAWVHGQFVVNRRPRVWREAGFGLAMGAGAVCSMLLAVPIEGAIFDLRASLIAIAAFFGGPLSGLVAATLAASYRTWLGGPAVMLGLFNIVGTGLVAYGVSVATRGRLRGAHAVLVLAIGVVATLLLTTFIGRWSNGGPVNSVALPVALMNGVATLVAAFFLMRHKGIEKERDLLRSAFLQAPDIQYIKRPDGAFAAVNSVLATRSGYSDPAELVGKSDGDILDAESAAAIAADDRELLATGNPKIDFEEEVADPFGDALWYLTSKVPLRDVDQQIVGIAGWTRDVTARKHLEQDVTRSRDQLNYVLAEMSEGVAMFDSQGTLAYCNERYQRLFPKTGETRRRGQHYRDILTEVVRTGEQLGPKPEQEEAWIDSIVGQLGTSGEEEVQLAQGGWLRIKRRPTSDGSTLMVVMEITKLKEAEAVLQSMTEQLKLLATTDGLTGLTNRRAFDQALENELSRCRRTNKPLSLLLIDVDRFKSYNDLYGHQAGDKVLKAVAQCLAQSLMRPGDVAARYGGEEFCAILPETDEDGAFFIADNFRETLRNMGMMHKGGDKGVVTASVGIATFTDRDGGLNSPELVRRADEALYDAKAAGRDRVLGWRARHEVRPAGNTRA